MFNTGGKPKTQLNTIITLIRFNKRILERTSINYVDQVHFTFKRTIKVLNCLYDWLGYLDKLYMLYNDILFQCCSN